MLCFKNYAPNHLFFNFELLQVPFALHLTKTNNTHVTLIRPDLGNLLIYTLISISPLSLCPHCDMRIPFLPSARPSEEASVGLSSTPTCVVKNSVNKGTVLEVGVD